MNGRGLTTRAGGRQRRRARRLTHPQSWNWRTARVGGARRRLAGGGPADGEVVLLGSMAAGKCVGVILEILRERLRVPADFVGRGDMSRGRLLLRSAVDRIELPYIPVAGAVRKGKRPPKLAPRRYGN